MDGEFLFSMADALLSSDSAKALTLLDQVIRDYLDNATLAQLMVVEKDEMN